LLGVIDEMMTAIQAEAAADPVASQNRKAKEPEKKRPDRSRPW